MSNYRLVEVYFINVEQLYPIHQWESDHLDSIQKYSIQIVYIKSSQFKIILYGFDSKIKKVYSLSTLDQIFSDISKMPMGQLYNKSNYDLCGLPSIQSTSHCFHDDTHRTCCLLGPKAREYSNQSGNPIGKASEDAFYKRYQIKPNKDILIPWCTCIGSSVCSKYQKMFNDGTHIKYIYTDKNQVNMDERDEKKYSIRRHKTPGV